jgi:hypothetical protein
MFLYDTQISGISARTAFAKPKEMMMTNKTMICKYITDLETRVLY